MKLKFNHSTQELVNFHIYTNWSAPWKANHRRKMGVIVPLSFALFALAFIINGGETLYLGIVLAVMAVLWLVFYNKFQVRQLEKFAKGHFNHEINERFWAEHEYHFSDKNIHLKNEYIDAKIQWKAIINYLEQEDVFWLFETLESAHIIPKRIMSETEQNSFKQILSKNLIRN